MNIEFKHSQLSIGELIELERSGKLNLSPHYQRNAIWAPKAQMELIQTIVDGLPLPNFFFRIDQDGHYEVVDGQQRCRAIFAFWQGAIMTNNKLQLTDGNRKSPQYSEFVTFFKRYPLSISILSANLSDAAVESFYVLVNKSGLRLNTPELRKAEYYSTRFLALATKISAMPGFEELNLFTSRSSDRMNDIDFISELLAYLIYGFTDKKDKVEAMYESDITIAQEDSLYKDFDRILNRVINLNSIVPIAKTRFRQKNDFYSLFAFVKCHPEIEDDCLEYMYSVLLRISPAIRPSQEYCEPLKQYALNCVSQSNSKTAREARDYLLNNILCNSEARPNDIQLKIADYYEVKPSQFLLQWGLCMLPVDLLKDPNQPEFTL
jgi:uncharacterized protein with ParB-like and HNH nuclease domain